MIDQRQFFASAFDELEGITKEALGAGLVQGARTFLQGARTGAQQLWKSSPRASWGRLQKAYQSGAKRGGVLGGLRTAVGTDTGKALAAGTGIAAAVPAATYGAGRLQGR